MQPKLSPRQRLLQLHELRRVDRVAQLVATCLPNAAIRATRDFYQFDQDDPDGFSILVTPESLELRLPTIEWTLGYMGPRSCSRLLERVPYPQKSLTSDTILELVQRAKDARRAEVKPCVHCGRLTEPGHAHILDGDWVCHGCSERYRGMVH